MNKEELMSDSQLHYINNLMNQLDYSPKEIDETINRKMTRKEATYLILRLLEELKSYFPEKIDRQIEEIKRRELKESE